jgi:hypothetical protein
LGGKGVGVFEARSRRSTKTQKERDSSLLAVVLCFSQPLLEDRKGTTTGGEKDKKKQHMDDIFGAPDEPVRSQEQSEADLLGDLAPVDSSPAFGEDANPFDDLDGDQEPAVPVLSGTSNAEAQAQARADAAVSSGLDDFVPSGEQAEGGDQLDGWFNEAADGGRKRGGYGAGNSGGIGGFDVGEKWGIFRDWVRDSTGPALFFIFTVVLFFASLSVFVLTIVQMVPVVPAAFTPQGVTADQVCLKIKNTTQGSETKIAGGGILQPVRFIFTTKDLDGQELRCPWAGDQSVPRLLTGLAGGVVAGVGFYGGKMHKKWLVWLYALLAAILGGAFFYEMCVDSHAVDLSTQTCALYGEGGVNAKEGLEGSTGKCAMMPFVITCLFDAGLSLVWFMMAFLAQRHVRLSMSRPHAAGVV